MRYISRCKKIAAVPASAFAVSDNPAAADQGTRPRRDDVSTTYASTLEAAGAATDMSISVGVNNIFDKDPPICLSCSLNGYDASTYDTAGPFLVRRGEREVLIGVSIHVTRRGRGCGPFFIAVSIHYRHWQ